MRFPIDLSLHLVTNRGSLALDEFFALIKKAIEGGVSIVQLREKDASTAEVVAIANELHAFLKPLGIPLIINDRVDVASVVHAEGVHLGQSDLNIRKARAILGPHAIIGLSVETLEQAKAVRDEKIDYLSASPLFFTKTKLDCSEPWKLEGLKALSSVSFHPVIAIGGINEANIEEVMACNVAGVAVISAIFDAPCPRVAAWTIKSRMKRDENI